MKAGRIVLLVFGIIIVLIGLGATAGGGIVLAIDGSFRDNQGFYTTHMIPVSSDSSAVVSEPADFRLEPGWWWAERNPITVRMDATNVNASKPVFVGIARDADLRNYLDGVSYDQVVGFTLQANRLQLVHYNGTRTPASPTAQNFWVASASGTGQQEILWDVTTGSYSLVLMNADGSATIDADVSLGAKIPEVLRGVGLGLLIGGIVFLVGGGVMIFFAAKG